jgi:hypothetical protein
MCSKLVGVKEEVRAPGVGGIGLLIAVQMVGSAVRSRGSNEGVDPL